MCSHRSLLSEQFCGFSDLNLWCFRCGMIVQTLCIPAKDVQVEDIFTGGASYCCLYCCVLMVTCRPSVSVPIRRIGNI